MVQRGEGDERGESDVVQRAREFLQRVVDTLREKNRLYGNSAVDPLRIFSRAPIDEQLKVRIDDKLSRLARGRGQDDEDVLLDLCGYIALLASLPKNSRGDGAGTGAEL